MYMTLEKCDEWFLRYIQKCKKKKKNFKNVDFFVIF